MIPPARPAAAPHAAATTARRASERRGFRVVARVGDSGILLLDLR
jgi:hypothetical protein